MIDTSNISIRQATPDDEPFLWEMLYQALYVPEGAEPFPREIVRHPDISRYVQGWGQPGDFAVIAIDNTNRQPIGAAWIRLMTGESKGYGYVDDQTPELSIAVAPEHRGSGVGTKLLIQLLAEAQNRYRAISLSVSSDNPAVNLYRRLGFTELESGGDSLIMIKRMKSV